MSSTFFGLNIGKSGLSAYQNALNTTANNIANVQTPGYSRQTATIQATDALRVTAKYGSVGTGAETVEITQDRNLYYDRKYWQNSSATGLYTSKLYYMEQIETIFTDDDAQDGFTTIFNKMFNSLDTLKTKAADKNVRNEFINQAQSLCTYFNSIATSLNQMQEDCNEEIKTTVDTINGIAEKISLINKEINRLELGSGGHANELRDERTRLLDQLSSLVEIETNEYYVKNSNGQELGGTNFSVYINGQTLVDGNDYRKLVCKAREYKDNQTDLEGLYDVYWEDTKTTFASTAGTADGYLKGLFLMRDGNNMENMKGTVSYESDPTRIVMTGCNVTNPNALNLPEQGEIQINGKKYAYSGWTATLDDDGNISKIAFDLKEESQVNTKDFVSLYESGITCGETVDGMGIVYYQQQVNEFLRTFVTMFNDIQLEGEDLNGDSFGDLKEFTDGNTMNNFFVVSEGNEDKNTFADSYCYDADGKITRKGVKTISSSSDTYDKLMAANVGVSYRSMKDPSYLSTTASITNGKDAYELVDEMKKLQKDVKMFRGNDAGSFLETLLSDVSVDTQKTTTFYQNYSNLTTAVDKQRMSVSGVDEDEEALAMIKFQNAYNLNSKVISIMAEIYDKLINETGV